MIEVAFICDDAFALPTGVALTSLAATRAPGTEYRVHVVSNGVRPANRRRLEAAAGDGVTVEIVEVDGSSFAGLASANAHVSPTAILKFRLGELFPNLERLLYLDGDIVVRKDLAELWATDLGDACVAAVEDPLAYTFAGKSLKERIGYPHERYFNSGVMLLNLARLRSDALAEKLMDYRLNGRNDFMDQDALNVVLGGAARFVDARFNVTATGVRYVSEEARSAAVRDAVIYHYASPEKPWLRSDADFVGLWDRHFVQSPFGALKLRRTVRTEAETLTRKLNGMSRRLREVQSELEAAVAQAAEAKARIAELEAKVAELEISELERKRLADRLWKQRCVYMETRDSLQAEVTQLKANVAEDAEKIAGLESERTDLERRLADGENEIKRCKQLGDRIWRQRTTLMGTRDRLRAEITQWAAKVAEAQERIKNLVSDVAEGRTTITALETVVADRDGKIGELAAEVTQLTAAVADRDGKIGELAAEVTQLTAVVADCGGKIGELETRVAEGLETIGGLEAELAVRDGRIAACEDEIARRKRIEAKIWHQRAENKLERLRLGAALRRSTQTVKARDAEIAGLKADVSELQTRVSGLENALSERTLELAVERNRVRIATGERDELGREASGLRAKLAEARERLSSAEGEVRELRGSRAYRLGRAITSPFRLLKDLMRKDRR